MCETSMGALLVVRYRTAVVKECANAYYAETAQTDQKSFITRDMSHIRVQFEANESELHRIHPWLNI